MRLPLERLVFCFCAILFLHVGSVSAEIYKWVDANGNVQFSDRKPVAKPAESVQVPHNNSYSGGQTSKSFKSTPTAPTNKPITYSGPGTSKTLRVERLLFDITEDQGSVVGRNYFSSSCSDTRGGKTWSGKRSDASPATLSRQLAAVLSENGYSAIDDSDVIFAGQERSESDYLLGAIITELELNLCYPGGAYNSSDTKAAAHLTIEWKVFDPLNRKVIFEGLSEGSVRQTYPSGDRNVDERVKAALYKHAIENLLAQRDFANVLAGEIPDPATAVKNASRDIALSYGNRSTEFTRIVGQLKQGTVTVRSASGHGSGFVINDAGYILTNQHVVGSATKLLVVSGGVTYPARIISADSRRDVAIIQLNGGSDFATLDLSKGGISSGEAVYVIGTPLMEGLEHTVTGGIISAKRQLDNGLVYYQTDAAVSPGSSGGPAFNRYGEVVGITVAGIRTASGNSESINFLIPIEEAILSLGLGDEGNLPIN